MIENAINDSIGIVKKPKISIYLAEHGIPIAHGEVLSGIIPNCKRLW